MERQQIKDTLTKLSQELNLPNLIKLEPAILKNAYVRAEQKNIALDWNGLFTNWYFACANRIIANITNNPEYFKNLIDNISEPQVWTHIAELKDIEMSKDMELLKVYENRKNIMQKTRQASMDHVCRKCKQPGIYISKQQTKSLDEGHTMVFTCSHCFFIWREN